MESWCLIEGECHGLLRVCSLRGLFFFFFSCVHNGLEEGVRNEKREREREREIRGER